MRVFFSRNVNHNKVTQISNELGFQLTADLGKYLGILVHHGRVSRRSYNYIC